MSNIITRTYNGNVFTFRADGYFNMTKAAQVFGKRLQHFWEADGTRRYCFELATATGLISRDSGDLSYGLVEAKAGRYGGTWGHPKLAVFFARWLDVKFAVFCDMVIDDILNKKAELTITKPEESAVMQLPKSFAEALRLAAELEEHQSN
ncbi:MAG: KilA-N domain-containing protein [Burkholderiaceae bacterium]|nr:KilA-N domain-containing protein [Burkholderiaceae bacterium]